MNKLIFYEAIQNLKLHFVNVLKFFFFKILVMLTNPLKKRKGKRPLDTHHLRIIQNIDFSFPYSGDELMQLNCSFLTDPLFQWLSHLRNSNKNRRRQKKEKKKRRLAFSKCLNKKKTLILQKEINKFLCMLFLIKDREIPNLKSQRLNINM